MHEFDSKDLKRLFGIPASQVRALVRAGHIHPLKKAGRLSYSFQDLIVLRTAGSLRAAKIPAQRINRTLREIRDSLPGALPLSGLSIVAVGDRIMVREGQALREGDTGQYTLDLEVVDRGGDLLVIDKRAAAAAAMSPPSTAAAGGRAGAIGVAAPADQAFDKGLELEDTDPAAARAAYEACLAADEHHLEARLNLGRLLHLDGRLEEARKSIGARSPVRRFCRSTSRCCSRTSSARARPWPNTAMRSRSTRDLPTRISTSHACTSGPVIPRRRCAICSPTGG